MLTVEPVSEVQGGFASLVERNAASPEADTASSTDPAALRARIAALAT